MLEKVKEIISQAMPEIDTSAITEETRLKEDLGFDSLSVMMISVEAEEAFGVVFKEFGSFKTVGDVCKYIQDYKK